MTSGLLKHRARGGRSAGKGARPAVRPAIEPLEARRLLAAVPLDLTFGVAGLSTYDIAGLRDTAEAVYVQPDGRILVAGQSTFALTVNVPVGNDGQPVVQSDTRGVLVRLNPDGSPDPTFGDAGVARHHSDPYTYVPPRQQYTVTRIDSAHAVAMQPDGKILVGGQAFAWVWDDDAFEEIGPDGRPRRVGGYLPDNAFAVARYHPDGTPDATFGTGGVALANFLPSARGGPEWVNALAVQPDGRIVAAGMVGKHESDSDMGVVRFNPDGTLDNMFGTVVEDFPALGGGNPSSDIAYALAVQPDGKVIIGGSSGGWNGEEHVGGFALVRYDVNGARDGSFGDNGRVVTRFPKTPDPLDARGTRGGGDLQHLALQPDGKIVAAGSLASANLAMARYNPDGWRDSSFADGGLLVTRAVINGQYRVSVGADGALDVAGVGNGTYYQFNAGPSGQDTIGHDTGLEAYAAQLDPAGRTLSTGRAERLTAPGENFIAFTVQGDGKLVLAGARLIVNDGTAGPGAEQAVDAIVARIDPALLPTGTGSPFILEPTVLGSAIKRRVRTGRALSFKLFFRSADAANGATVAVTGPNDFSAEAQRVGVKAGRLRAVATYRVAAPGGRFDAADNGIYQVRAGGASGQVYGQFTVAARAPRGTRPLQRIVVDAMPRTITPGQAGLVTGVLRNDVAFIGGETTGWVIRRDDGSVVDIDGSAPRMRDQLGGAGRPARHRVRDV